MTKHLYKVRVFLCHYLIVCSKYLGREKASVASVQPVTVM